MIEPGTFLYFLDKETMNFWETDRTEKGSLERNLSKDWAWVLN